MARDDTSRLTRRTLLGTSLKAGAAVAAAPLSSILTGCMSFVQQSPVNILVPKEYESPSGFTGWWYKRKLAQATMDFIRDNNNPKAKLGIWRVPLRDIEYALEERIEELADYAVDACNENKDTHPLDPAQLMAGMYVESLFYEFAISKALAVGVAQFIAPTARATPFKMVCAGDLPEHRKAPYQLTEFATAQLLYEKLKKDLKGVRKTIKQKGGTDALRMEREEILYEMTKAKRNYKQYLLANVAGKNVMDSDHQEFLNEFDQRTVLEHAVKGMGTYIARNLRARSGDPLSAWSGYNAGLGSTKAGGYLKKFGKLPNGATATYAKKIVLISQDLNKRMFG